MFEKPSSGSRDFKCPQTLTASNPRKQFFTPPNFSSIQLFFLTAKMGRDHHVKPHKKSSNRTAPKSDNVYLKSLVTLYSYLARM